MLSNTVLLSQLSISLALLPLSLPLEAAGDLSSPLILQLSHGGSAYFAGKGASNSEQAASISGAVAATYYVRGIALS